MALRAVPEHPKFAQLQFRLSLEKYEALGILEATWHFTGRFAPQGNVGKYSDEAIAKWIGWKGDPAALVAALVEAGWLDRNEGYRLITHDWHMHADHATRLSLKRGRLTFCMSDGPTPDLQGTTPDAQRPKTGDGVHPAEGLPEAGAGAEAGAEAGAGPGKKTKTTPKAPPVAVEVPEWIPREAWDAWIEVRRKKRAANTERALRLAVRELEKLRAEGDSPEAVLNQSTMRSWTGLFPVKGGKVTAPPAPPKEKTPYELAAEAQRMERQAAMREAGIQ